MDARHKAGHDGARGKRARPTTTLTAHAAYTLGTTGSLFHSPTGSKPHTHSEVPWTLPVPAAIAFHERLGGSVLRRRNADLATEGAKMLAARLDRLKQDQGLLALLLGQDGSSSSGFGGANVALVFRRAG